MRKRYQKDSLASMKNSGEIHEQLVTYDEEGGGEMDTNGYVDEKKPTFIQENGSVLRWYVFFVDFSQNTQRFSTFETRK